MKKIFITLAAIMLLPILSVQAQVGITAVPFLQIEPDSRATGMGNTGVAVADNASAIFWNPAGLAFQNQNQISVTHANWLPAFNADLFYDYLVGTYYVDGIGTIGGHITFLNLGEQIRTDETGLELGRFNSFEISAGLSYGFQISDNFSLGTGLRYIYSSLADGSVSGQEISPGSSVGIDLAGLYKTNPFQLGNRQASFNAGFNLSNIGPGIQYTDNAQKDPLPTIMRLGWAYTMDIDANGINTLTLSNDISKIMARNERVGTDPDSPEYETMGVMEALFNSWGSYERFNGTETVDVSLGQQLMYGFGLEYWYDELFALRSGYYYEHPENGNREFITLGAGLRYNIFGVDFSYIYTLEDDHPLANTIRLSVLMNFR
ncbi:type IX secretion system outer membrane channel protein PorV [Rhodohalobacter sulfatireducens]|uniref:Type IX secretion system outer membrane channel protein PorV n=1 Tax=Rhodohalobacter sulfatireducens TaxID=2911366 RepID=A0ABS9KH43_9BACT|nr:type IX secretion system outer membrane channel protein PorV [Rhodohalobacter sulfatireducens]MCG2590172.1 type IX secretion system outer membrane channel protein PorV [Rhodohalobacter sulfatireducens]